MQQGGGVGGEEENPLGTQYEDPPQSKKYKPVLSGDGFIVPRAKPTVEVCVCVCVCRELSTAPTVHVAIIAQPLDGPCI